MTTDITIRNVGTSLGVIFPKTILSSLSVKKGDKLEMSINEGTIILTPQTSIRKGWREKILHNYKDYNHEELLPDYLDYELEKYL